MDQGSKLIELGIHMNVKGLSDLSFGESDNPNHWGSLGWNCEWPVVSSFANGGWGAMASYGHVN